MSLEAIVQSFADLLVPLVAARLASTTHRMVAQYGSPLGARRHRAAVKRRVERGEGGASVVGRRYLLSHEAMAAELSMPQPVAKAKPRRPDHVEAARQEARLALQSVRKAAR